MPRLPSDDARSIHSSFASGMRNFLSRGSSNRAVQRARRGADSSAHNQQTPNTVNSPASAPEDEGIHNSHEDADQSSGATGVVTALFQRHQSQDSIFIPSKYRFPAPTAVSVPAVWSWQMGQADWVPFDVQVMELLESLWAHMQSQQQQQQQDEQPDALVEPHEEAQELLQAQEQEDQQPEGQLQHGTVRELGESDDSTSPTAATSQARLEQSHKVYAHISPWQYCLDLGKMTQQNLATRRVRPIRRNIESVGLWFAKGSDGHAERFPPEVEVHLEALWKESLQGVRNPSASVLTWENQRTGHLHYTDVIAMRESLNTGSQREIMRTELVAEALLNDSAEAVKPGDSKEHSFPLPSLEVGTEESGEAICKGHRKWLESDDFDAALVVVEGHDVPDDTCVICLDSLVQEPSTNAQQSKTKKQRRRSNMGKDEKCCSRGGSSSRDTKDISGTSSRNRRRSNSKIACTTIAASPNESDAGPSSNADCDMNSPKDTDSKFPDSNKEEVVRLINCSHHFHTECIRMYVQSCTKGGFYCPTCNVLQLPGNGPCPPGKMKWRICNRPLLAGHPDEGTIIIDYIVSGGIQTERHARPSIPFTGARRQAYLPDCLMGRRLLRLLIQAFVKGHIFTVGDSVTSGQSNVVVWNGIHHKTSVSGGVLHYGYPDDTFLSRLAEELKARGFPLEADSPSAVSV
ncbi:zinc finger (C3HC4 RING finger) protein, putative [Eimeria tenella]|uniref:RING-type E3 ubiquitin transferase n=1 Tax=Eimeria tenella TaxID=5802 RepID=U6L2R9_EIMTE|nr:zinc finger (C3HC4 RING finger) protein, putative [Eimeria tenella]CDJ42904.1 zinc finger (C3HC4 RING finger) protein, putative [Eimeria tenella]|eukprot:XP_013233654.1 zinc finger (C3HC4 RING finger) protein, putative [Eimeria tenella]